MRARTRRTQVTAGRARAARGGRVYRNTGAAGSTDRFSNANRGARAAGDIPINSDNGERRTRAKLAQNGSNVGAERIARDAAQRQRAADRALRAVPGRFGFRARPTARRAGDAGRRWTRTAGSARRADGLTAPPRSPTRITGAVRLMPTATPHGPPGANHRRFPFRFEVPTCYDVFPLFTATAFTPRATLEPILDCLQDSSQIRQRFVLRSMLRPAASMASLPPLFLLVPLLHSLAQPVNKRAALFVLQLLSRPPRAASLVSA